MQLHKFGIFESSDLINDLCLLFIQLICVRNLRMRDLFEGRPICVLIRQVKLSTNRAKQNLVEKQQSFQFVGDSVVGYQCNSVEPLLNTKQKRCFRVGAFFFFLGIFFVSNQIDLFLAWVDMDDRFQFLISEIRNLGDPKIFDMVCRHINWIGFQYRFYMLETYNSMFQQYMYIATVRFYFIGSVDGMLHSCLFLWQILVPQNTFSLPPNYQLIPAQLLLSVNNLLTLPICLLTFVLPKHWLSSGIELLEIQLGGLESIIFQDLNHRGISPSF